MINSEMAYHGHSRELRRKERARKSLQKLEDALKNPEFKEVWPLLQKAKRNLEDEKRLLGSNVSLENPILS